jgi:lauroyl/myristoyl acyltransferase
MKIRRKIRADSILPTRVQNFFILHIFLAAKVFIWLAARLKEDQVKFLVRIFYLPFSGFNRKICRRNLASVFGSQGRTPAQLKQIHKAYLEYMIRFQAETLRCFSNTPGEWSKKVLLEGEAFLQAALKQGGGVMLVSGHMGTWWHIPGLLMSRGYKVNVVFNSFPFPIIENYLKQQAARHGMTLVFVDKGVPQLIRRAARNNEVVYLTFDVAVLKHHTNWLPFGSTKININPGPATLALRNKIPVHYVSSCHRDEKQTQATIHPETAISGKNSRKDSNDLSRQWAEKLYADIMRHPEQWWGWGFSDLPCGRTHK